MTWLRYYYQPGIQAAAVFALCVGGWVLWLPMALAFLTNSIADEVLPNYGGVEPDMPFQDGPLYLASALMVAVLVLWTGVVALSFDALAASASFLTVLIEPQPLWALLGGFIGVAMLIAAIANVAHEFCHRLSRPWHRFLGQALLAMAFHPSLPIEHVFGHHRNVGTWEDPATARRGEGFWRYFVRSVSGTFRNAHAHEEHRLRNKNLPGRIAYNRTFQGYGLVAAWLIGALTLGGLPGLLGFVAAGLWGMVTLELYQYISHYGLVRLPGAKVRADHSWEWSRAVTSSFMLNLPRHGAHHLNGTKSYWQLDVTSAAPTYPLGPNLMAAAALVPPLFHRLARPALSDWDERFATAAERAYAIQAHHSSSCDQRHVQRRS